MANGGYSALKVIVTADTRGLSVQIKNAATSAGEEASRSIGNSIGAGLKALAPVGAAALKGIATGIATVTTAAVGFGVSAFQTAARVGELDATLRALAKANNLSYDAMQKQVQAVKDTGIQTQVAQNLVAQFARSQLNLADATKLAKVAQDAAVLSQKDSSETLNDLVHGITTQNSLVLKNAGIQVQAGKAVEAYAKSVGKSVKELTDAERAQAVLNAVLEDGDRIAGAYSEAMTEPGKVLRSFKRIVEEVKLSVGKGLLDAFRGTILGTYQLASSFEKAIRPGGLLAPIITSIGKAAAQIAAPLEAAVKAAEAFLKSLKPEQVKAAAAAIERFGPAVGLAAGAITLLSAPGLLGGIPLLGPIISNLIGPFTLLAKQITSVGVAAVGAKAGAGTLGAALGGAAAPITAIIAAIALLIATSAPFRKAMVDLGRSAVEAFQAFLPSVKQALPLFRPVVDVVVELARAVGGVLGPAISALAPALVPIGSLLGSLLVILGGLTKVAAAVLIPVIRLVGAFLQLTVVKLTVPYFTRFVQVLTTVANAVATVVRWILGGSPGLIPALRALGGALGAILGPLASAGGAFRALASTIASAFSAMLSATTGGMSRIRSAVQSGMSAAGSAVKSGASAMLSAVRSMASGFSSAGSAAGNALRSSITGGINSARSAVQSGVNAMISAARSLVGGFASAGSAAASAMAGAISGGLNAVVGQVQSKLASVVNAAKNALKIGSPSKIMWAVGLDFVAGFLGAILAANIAGPVAAAFGGAAVAAAVALGPSPSLGLGAVGLDHGAATPYAPGPDLGTPFAGLEDSLLGGLRPGGITVNVYPQPGQSETEIAAAVSRRLAWAAATGRAD